MITKRITDGLLLMLPPGALMPELADELALEAGMLFFQGDEQTDESDHGEESEGDQADSLLAQSAR